MPAYLSFTLPLLLLLITCGQIPEGEKAVTVAQSGVTSPFTSEIAHPSPASGKAFRSTDGGLTWNDISEGLPVNASPTTVYASGGEILVGSLDGLYRQSIDQPQEQQWKKEYLLDVIRNEPIGAIIPGPNGMIARSHPSGFFQRMPGTGMWKPLYTGLGRKEVYDVLHLADGAVLISTSYGVYRDRYKADIWGQVFVQGQVLDLVETDGVILGAGEIGVIRSTDDGNHWQWVLTEDGRSRKITMIDGQVYAISMGKGGREDDLKDPGQSAARLRRSGDGGLTWTMLDPGHALGQQIYDIVAMEGALLCTSSKGLYRSDDRGLTWTCLRPAQNNEQYGIAVDGRSIFLVPILNGC